MFGAVDCMDLHDILRPINPNTSNLVHDVLLRGICVIAAMMTPDGADSAIGKGLTNSDHDCDLGRESCRAWLAIAPIIGA
ncbi:hypothetical protein WK99_12660 [Burkholderia ubonensis]|nr:hypothetical protein WK99_12660 [Burkholderia ubonensis]